MAKKKKNDRKPRAQAPYRPIPRQIQMVRMMEFEFKGLLEQRDKMINELDSVSEDVRPIMIRKIQGIDKRSEELINNYINYINTGLIPIPEMKSWTPFSDSLSDELDTQKESDSELEREEEVLQVIERNYTILEHEEQNKEKSPTEINDETWLTSKEIIQPKLEQKLIQSEAFEVCRKLLNKKYETEVTIKDQEIMNHKSFKAQRSKFIRIERMKENFPSILAELKKQPYVTLEKFFAIVNPPSPYYAEILKDSFIKDCNSKKGSLFKT